LKLRYGIAAVSPRFAKIRRILKIPKTAVLCLVIWHDKLDMTKIPKLRP
jgi:hypothetical protein